MNDQPLASQFLKPLGVSQQFSSQQSSSQQSSSQQSSSPSVSTNSLQIELSQRFLLVFLDGFGLGNAGDHNPLSSADTMPFLSAFLAQPLLENAAVEREGVLLKPIDPTLSVEGLPQSATGQTTIYTGQNAPKFLGRHQSGFANGSLRQLIDEYGLFSQVLRLGKTATLANAYSPEHFYAIAHRRRRYSVCTLLNLTAHLPFRMQYEYEKGEAIFWDIVGQVSSAMNRRSGERVPITPAESGQRLAALSARYDMTLFECYLTDYAGHRQDKAQALACLQRIDAFLESAIAHLPPDVTLIVTSDHGNVEDLSTKRHTLNTVPLIAIGSNAREFESVEDLTGIAPKILSLMGKCP
ncbi:MAG: alkaline phosphatase family protein [Phormidesmis sp.]